MSNTGKHWSEEDRQYLAQHYGITPLRIMSKHMGRKKSAIKWMAQQLRITSEVIVPECRSCTRHDGKRCDGWTDPAYMWRDGKVCPGFTTNPDARRQTVQAIMRYSKNKGHSNY